MFGQTLLVHNLHVYTLMYYNTARKLKGLRVSTGDLSYPANPRITQETVANLNQMMPIFAQNGARYTR